MSTTPPPDNKPGLQVTRYHAGMVDAHLALQRSMDKNNVVESMQAISRALREFEEFSRTDRERFLQGGLAQTGGDQAVCEWISARYDHLATMARRLVPVEEQLDAEQGARLAPAWALAIM